MQKLLSLSSESSERARRLLRLPRATPVALASSAAGLAYYAGLYFWRVDLCESTLQHVDDTLSREGNEGGARRGAAAHPDFPPGRRQDVREFRRALSAPPSHVTAVTSHSPGSAGRFVAAALGGRAATARVRLPPAAAESSATSSIPYTAAARAVASGLGIEFLSLRHQAADLLPVLASGDGNDSSSGGGRRELLLALETATAALVNIRAQDPKHHLPPIIVIEGLLGETGYDNDGGAAEALLSWCREVTTERQLAHVVLTASEEWVVRQSGLSNAGGDGGGFHRDAAAAAAATQFRGCKGVNVWALKPPARDDAEAFIRTRLQTAVGAASSGSGGGGGGGGGDEETASSAALLVDVLHGPVADASGLLREAARLLARERWRTTSAERAEAALQDMSLAAWGRTVAAIRLLATSGAAADKMASFMRRYSGEAAVAAPPGGPLKGKGEEARQGYGRLPELFALMRLLGRDRAIPLSSALALLGAGDSAAAIEDMAALCRLGILRLTPRGLCDDVTVLPRPHNATQRPAAKGLSDGAEKEQRIPAAETAGGGGRAHLRGGEAGPGESDSVVAAAVTAAATVAEEGGSAPIWQPTLSPQPAPAFVARAAVLPRVTAAQNSASSSAAAAAAMSDDAAFAFQVSVANPLVAGAFLVLEHWPTLRLGLPSKASPLATASRSEVVGSGGLGDVARREAVWREAMGELARQRALLRHQEEVVSELHVDLARQAKAFASRRADRQPAANQRFKASLSAAEDDLQYEELELARRRAAARAAAAAANAAVTAVSSSGSTAEDLAVAAAQEVTARIVQAAGASGSRAARYSEAATRNAASTVLAGVAAAGGGVLTAGDIQMVLCALGRFFSAEEVREGVAALARRRNGDVDAAALAAHFLGTDLQRRETQRLRRRATAEAAAATGAAAAKGGSDGAAAVAGDDLGDAIGESDAEDPEEEEEEEIEQRAADPPDSLLPDNGGPPKLLPGNGGPDSAGGEGQEEALPPPPP